MSTAKTKQPTVYIVDDHPAVRDSIRWLVQQVGLAARTFASAKEFLASPDPDMHGCLVLDIRMPGMSGLELQSLLRAQGRVLPIIFITAFPEDSVRKRALDAGAICFLIKPFDGPTLIKYLDKALERDGGR